VRIFCKGGNDFYHFRTYSLQNLLTTQKQIVNQGRRCQDDTGFQTTHIYGSVAASDEVSVTIFTAVEGVM
jgi:hypothetical protein